MPLSTIFQLNRGSQFYWWRKPEDSEKTTDLLQVTAKSVFRDQLPYVNIFQCSLGRSHKIGLTVHRK